MTFSCLALLSLLQQTPAQSPPPTTKPVDKPATRPIVVVSPEALKIHNESFVFDGHNDLPWELRRKDGLNFKVIDLHKPQPKMHTDIERLRKGNVGAQFWSAYVPVDTVKRGEAVKTTLEQINLIHRMVEHYNDVFEMARTAKDIERIRGKKKIASLIGVEGGHSIDSSLDVLEAMSKLGVGYMTLTHSENTPWADSATDTPKVNGLSPQGVKVIETMNRLGMIVDISHVSPDCMKAALKATKAPVMFSHSSARAIADHPRNVPDDVLKLLKENNGVCMVNFYSGFILPEAVRATKKMFEVGRELRKKYPNDAEFREAMRAWQKDNDYPRGSVHDVVDHIEHIIKVAGVDHVGLGSDFDGIMKTPEQLDDVSTYPVITQELINRGYKADDIHKILSQNIMRVIRDVEKAKDAGR
jgi:membrane dipeptidase